MTFEEAVELAKAIHGNSAFCIIAIGRFKPTEELTDAWPWGISIISRVTSARSMIWTEEDWRRAAAPPAKPRSNGPPAIDDGFASNRKKSPKIEQPSLF